MIKGEDVPLWLRYIALVIGIYVGYRFGVSMLEHGYEKIQAWVFGWLVASGFRSIMVG